VKKKYIYIQRMCHVGRGSDEGLTLVLRIEELVELKY